MQFCWWWSLSTVLFLYHFVLQVSSKEYPPFNGWYNNFNNPSAGSYDTSLTRRVIPKYEDGVYAPNDRDRPNPRKISSIFSGMSGLPSESGKTALFYFFGEHVMHEITDEENPGCPPEFYNIPVPIGDPVFDPLGIGTITIPYQRAGYDQSNTGYSPNTPREQLNTVTSYLDGSAIYGRDRSWSNQLRLFRTSCPGRSGYIYENQFASVQCSGELSSQDNLGFLPALNTKGLPLDNPVPPTKREPLSATRQHQVGGRQLNENPFLLAISTVWFRHHNWWSGLLSQRYPDWSEERVFNEARLRNVATYQNIVMNEWLPLLIGDCPLNSSETCSSIPSYSAYSSSTSSSVSDVFQVAAKHFIHTMAPLGVYTRSEYRSSSNNCNFNTDTMRICNTYWIANEILRQTPIHEIIMGMASQIAEKEDYIINDDLLNSFYGPLQFSRRDFVALIIQQGRDYGLPDYNTIREELGLSRKSTFEEINPELFNENPQLLINVRNVYNKSIDYLDVFVGGMLETKNGQPGELFRLVLVDQFRRLRDGDRFWFENTRNGLLSSAEIEDIKNTSFRDVILRTNPNMNENVDIQDFPFLWNATGDSKLFCRQPYQIGSSSQQWSANCTALETYDYFTTSRVSFAVVFAVIGIFVFLCILLMYLLAKHRQSIIQKNRTRIAREKSKSLHQTGINGTVATEILGTKSSHQVQITFGPTKTITVKTAKGSKKLRTIFLDDDENVELLCTIDGNVLIFKSIKATYDLVLKFFDGESYEEFISALKVFLNSQSIHLKRTDYSSETTMLTQAMTKEKRDKDLQKFFKAALAQSLKIQVDDSNKHLSRIKSKKLANTEINQEEFAEFLKLKPENSFVQQMFSAADTNEDGMVSFREFLDITVLFTKGSPEDKARLMFNMYDSDQSGELSVEEFKTMLKSTMEMVNATIDVERLDQVVTDLMSSHDLGNKQSLSLDDFLKIMGNYSNELSEAHLVIEGQKPPPATKVPPPQSSQINQLSPTVSLEGTLQQNGEVAQSSTQNNPPSAGRYIKRNRPSRLSRARLTIKRHQEQPNQPKLPLQRRHSHHFTSLQVVKEKHTKNKFKKLWIRFVKWNQHYRNHIFCIFLYTLITIGVFLQSHNVVANNHPSGLLRIGGGWVAVARAAAAALMFNFSTILLTMSRNTITFLRETPLHRYIPFDSAISMHKFIAWMALFFTALHVVAHGINFYSISTQSPLDLLCLFRDYWFPSDFLPNFVFWCFQTITGVTGVILTLDVILIYVFASNYSRRAIFNWFQGTHRYGYLLLYFFSVLHGSGTLISSPRFYLYFLGPAILFTLDKVYSYSRKKAEISVVKAEILPSDVTYLEFKRPQNFDYKAGQWVRIACLSQSPSEYHPFTLSSAPHERTLKLHIRAVGPWTQNLRTTFNPESLREAPYPKLYLDGPFGEGHQDWYKYEVSVLVGGGIGVTPFASILKDLVYANQNRSNMTCEAVYFIWVTRDQKQYEWLMDIIQEVERKDTNKLLNTHIFITQFPQKFDLRTTMLYICEERFQKIAGKSLFTGLQAVTHFGRPNFLHFFESLAQEHNKVKSFGVFSCGPPAMTSSVEKACTNLNKYEGPSYNHHFENF